MSETCPLCPPHALTSDELDALTDLVLGAMPPGVHRTNAIDLVRHARRCSTGS